MESRLINYLTTGIWRIRLRNFPPVNAFFIRQLRIVVLTVRKALEDKASLRASALTFYSVLSVGPLIALVLGIAKGFGLQKRLETEILTQIPAQEEVLKQILGYAKTLLENTQGGVVAGVGVVVLLWSAVKVFYHLEHAFNEIWQAKDPRSWKKTISNYLAFLFLTPLFLLIYSSIPAFVARQLDEYSSKLSLLAKVSPFIIDLLQFSPYLLVWALFSLVYVVIPNTRVIPRAGIISGVLAGTVYLLVQWGLVEFQVGVTMYNPVYGSLIALPLLLIWINIGWIILLIGAEYAYAHQNVDLHEFEPDFVNISPHYKKVLTLQILHRLVLQFSNGDPPLNTSQISQQLEIPVRLTQQIMGELKAAGLVSLMSVNEDREPAYQPSSDIHRWTIKFVTDALEKRGVNQLPVAQTDTLKAIESALDELGSVMDGSDANRLLLKI
ncbi:MAG: YihY/virulence factor BrkB family protein [Desulfobacterales bacterium]